MDSFAVKGCVFAARTPVCVSLCVCLTCVCERKLSIWDLLSGEMCCEHVSLMPQYMCVCVCLRVFVWALIWSCEVTSFLSGLSALQVCETDLVAFKVQHFPTNSWRHTFKMRMHGSIECLLLLKSAFDSLHLKKDPFIPSFIAANAFQQWLSSCLELPGRC